MRCTPPLSLMETDLKETKKQKWQRLHDLAIRKGATREEAVATANLYSRYVMHRGPKLHLVQGGLSKGK